MREPRDLAEAVERAPALAAGNEERFSGYGVMAAPFRSGHILAMRRFPGSSLGPGYTSVWHRAPDGAWTFYSDRDPLESCARYFGSALTRSEVAAIEVAWTGPRRLEVRVPAARLDWRLELAATPATRLLSAVGTRLPDTLWRSDRALATLGRVASRLLRAGQIQLTGRAPNGQHFLANPQQLWVIAHTSARLGDEDFGEPGPVREQAHLGDFWIPQRGLFAVGRVFFEPADLARHRLVAQSPALSPA